MVYWRSASAGGVGAPKLPCVSSPLINFDGAVQVWLNVTWSASSVALGPVSLVDLPESDIVSVVGVVEHSVSISSTFVWDDALAAALVPTVLGTPCADIGI